MKLVLYLLITTDDFNHYLLALLVILVVLLVYNSRSRQQTNRKVKAQGAEIEKQYDRLRHLVTENDWLEREIHHRVKSNLQMVISLLNAQTEFLNHPSAIDAIKEIRERMQAIAILHQKLYQLDNNTLVNMKSYVNELIENIRNSFADSERIHFQVDVDEIFMDISQSVPLSLILNEAISNAVKHAYPGNEKGVIQVSLKNSTNGTLQLKIADSGRGLPGKVDVKQIASLGMQLIRLFSEQLEGDLYFRNNHGLEIMLFFKFFENQPLEDRKIMA